TTFLFSSLFAAERKPPNMQLWSKYDVITLKRNQIAKYHLIIDGVSKFLTFRWTLYVNEGLVMLYEYEKFTFQNILYISNQLQGYRLNLKNRAENAFDYPFALIVFAEFDDKKQEAMFEFFLKDEKRTILLERLAPKEE
ncbi:MAG: hypothetical protein RL154_1374, partial [Pseudomonadota bacterium]